MKKIYSIFVLLMAVFLLTGCGDDKGEFPEINENKEVEMSADEIITLLSAVDMETGSQEAMMLSIDLEMSVTNENTDFWTDTVVSNTNLDLTLSSTTYMLMHDEITEVKLLSENEIDLNMDTTYVNDSSLNEENSLKGNLNAYFVNQYFYYDANLESSTELLENGKYKMNLGITQSMWDELFSNPEDLVGDYVDIGIDIETVIEDNEMIGVMLDSDMLKIFQSGGETTAYIHITKQSILENAHAMMDAMYDTENWTEEDYAIYISDIEESLEMFSEFDVQVAFVIEDEKMIKMGYQFDISGESESMSIDISGTMVFDMFVDMPSMPSDLETYELTEFPLDMLFNSYM